MTLDRKKIGRYGELLAINFLEKKGYQIIAQNVTSKWGEIDIVAKLPGKIAFIEVKTRVGTSKGKPYEAVKWHKIQHLKLAINYYILIHKLNGFKHSLDVVDVILTPEGKTEKITFYQNVVY